MFYGCSKGGSTKSSSAPGAIVGTWYVTGDTSRRFTNGIQTFLYGNSNSGRHQSYRFSSNGSGYVRIDTLAGTLNFTYKITGSTLIFNYPAQTYNDYPQQPNVDTTRIGTLNSSNLEIISTSSFSQSEYDLYLSK